MGETACRNGIILPERVLGSAGAQCTLSGEAKAPISLRHWPRSSVYGESEHCPFGGVDTADASRLENSANATSHPRTPPGDAVDDDLVNDQMPVNVGITDDGAAAAQSEASGAVTEPSFLKQLGIRLGYALRPGPSFRR